MAGEWNVKKDLLWGLALTAGLIVLYELYKWYQTQQAAAATAASAAAAAAAQAAAGSGLANQIANLGSTEASAGSEGTAPTSTSTGVAATTAGPSAQNYISPGAQIGAISQDTINALLGNSQSVTNPTPIAAVQPVQPSASTVTGLPSTSPVTVPVIASSGPVSMPALAPTNLRKAPTVPATSTPLQGANPPSAGVYTLASHTSTVQ